jgi:hypothetical protein
VVVDCLIEQNNDHGVLASTVPSSPSVIGGTIRDDAAFLDGAGVKCIGSSMASFHGVVISGNQANQFGGGVFAGSAGVVLEECTLVANEANSGGGVHVTGGFVSIVGCLIAGNEAFLGGAVYVAGSASIDMVGCTVTGNEVGSRGGGVACASDAFLGLTKAILSGNCGWMNDEVWLSSSGSVAEFTCCAVDSSGFHEPSQEGEFIFVGEQVWTDPLFCGPASCFAAPTPEGDYTLDAGSPCLPGTSPCGELIGALSQGCGAPTTAVGTTWGRIKRRYGELR